MVFRCRPLAIIKKTTYRGLTIHIWGKWVFYLLSSAFRLFYYCSIAAKTHASEKTNHFKYKCPIYQSQIDFLKVRWSDFLFRYKTKDLLQSPCRRITTFKYCLTSSTSLVHDLSSSLRGQILSNSKIWVEVLWEGGDWAPSSSLILIDAIDGSFFAGQDLDTENCVEVWLNPPVFLLTMTADVDECVAVPNTEGNARRRPARMLGRQVHTTAVVVSRVVQKVTGILSHVGWAVRPKDLRV